MAQPIVKTTLTFSGDASTSGNNAYFPASLRGQYLNWTVYVEYSAGSAAGKVQIQTAFADDWITPGLADYSGTWANLGSTLDWAVASSQKTASVVGVYDLIRLNINTTVTTGTVKAYLIASPVAV